MTGPAGQPHVVILGAGFGGLFAARAFAGKPVRVTLVDRRNHHTFQPLLYQVATAGLNAADIAVPIRRILRHQKNAFTLLAEAEAIDPPGRRVLMKGGGAIDYDYLIVATGATHSYFGHPDWEKLAPGLKSIEDALEIRKRIFFAFEAAEREEDPEIVRAFMTFVLIGGGATGVELAGTLAEIAKKTLAKDFRRIDPTKARVILLEGAQCILAGYSDALRLEAKAQLERLGVEVQVRAMVTGVDDRGVMVTMGGGPDGPGRQERIEARTVLWAAGVAASPLAKSLGLPLDRAGRVRVEKDLTVPGYPEIHVIGDVAFLEQDGAAVPGVARAAIDGGRHAAKDVLRAIRGEPTKPFVWKNPGMLATIGRGAAIAEFGRVKLSGFVAWLAWLVIHIAMLIGFRNRLLVLVEWAFAYLAYDRGARLITGKLPQVAPHELAAPHAHPTPAAHEAEAAARADGHEARP